MRSAPDQDSSYSHRAPLRRRAIGLLLAVAVHALLLLVLIRLAPPMQFVPVAKPQPMSFDLLPEAQVTSPKTRTATKSKRASGGGGPSVPAPKPAPPKVETTPPEPEVSLGILLMTKEEYAAADISKLPSHAAERGSGSGAGSGAGADTGSDAGDGPGQGPNGERLYNAEWYREPTHAELSTYLPRGAPARGWAMIACQTVERFHVDRCIELGDSPPGSGLARAMRRAAWQFLVRPPRIGGKSEVGAWVRIRIDFTATGSDPPSG